MQLGHSHKPWTRSLKPRVLGAQFVPFIQGPRNCLGQYFALLEARVVISLLVKVRSGVQGFQGFEYRVLSTALAPAWLSGPPCHGSCPGGCPVPFEAGAPRRLRSACCVLGTAVGCHGTGVPRAHGCFVALQRFRFRTLRKDAGITHPKVIPIGPVHGMPMLID